MSKPHIFVGDARDVASIMPVMERAFDPVYGEAWTAAQCLSLLAVPGTALFIAEQERKISGFALTRWIIDEEELLMIGVDPDYQRQGIAHNLLSHIVDKARNEKRSRIFLEVRSNNPALSFYQNFGFEYCGTRKSYYRGINGDRFDATTMALNL